MSGHSDGDGCAVYEGGYRVLRRGDESEVRVEDLEPGDDYNDPASDAPGDWLAVDDVWESAGGDVHVASS